MKLSITVIALCLVPIVWGQILNQADDPIQDQGKAILDLQSRLSAVEHLRNEDALRIADLSKQQQIDQRRIADLEKQQKNYHNVLSDLVNKRDEDNRTIADLEQKQQDDHVRIADLEKNREDNHQRIAYLEKQQRFYIDRIADLEKTLRDGDKRQVTYPQKQQHRRKLDSHYKFHLESFTNSTARTTEVRRMPSIRKTNTFEQNPSHSELSSPTLEISNQGINKRVSPDNHGMVAFYAVLTHSINPLNHLMEIHFDKVITNIGGSYSGNTGTFTCNHAGAYVFSWTVQVIPRYMYTQLVKNGVMIGTAFSGDSQHSATGGGSVVVQLDHGDEVWVRENLHASGSYILSDRQTATFSGFLLR